MSLEWIPINDVQCGDGTNAGFWRSSPERGGSVQNNLVVVFLGGGVCTTVEECDDIAKNQPYKLSGKYFPSQLEGYTVLSYNVTENPVLFDYHKILVPYCSQDTYLGSGKLGDHERQGSLHFLKTLDYISQTWSSSTSTMEQLVFIGVSAGALGVLNQPLET